MAKQSGLQTSTSGFFNYAEDLDAALAIAGEGALKLSHLLNSSFAFHYKRISNRINL